MERDGEGGKEERGEGGGGLATSAVLCHRAFIVLRKSGKSPSPNSRAVADGASGSPRRSLRWG